TELGARQRTLVEHGGISAEPIEAQLAVLPVRAGEARLVWNFQVYTLDDQHAYDLTVDASTGEVWTRIDWVAADTYKVYPRPVESPNHTTPLPFADARVSLLNPANVTASPFGWHDTNGIAGAEFTIMRGNNVHAYDEIVADGLPPAVQPDCGVALNCSFPINLAGAPNTYTSAAVANLFYWNNVIHDIQYQYGFDAVGGNFQVNNYGLGGLGNDDVRAEAQDGGGMNNANFLTPPDGSRPRMQMYLWNGGLPNRDGDLDSGIIVHEYGHGISNRLVGGPSNVSCLGNAQQPGEGISDFLALMYTAKATDTGPLKRGIGTYALFQPTTGNGIRAQPYSTNPALNTWTYGSIASMAGAHAVGSVFAQGMWEAYWALVDRWGFNSNLYNATGTAGNQRMMLYFTQGLKNTPCSPTFTQVRDGIIQAATTLHGGADVCRLWTAFAAFGLGVDAVPGGPNTTAVTNGFNVPASCKTDVWGKDKPWDTGNQPDAATAGNVMWESEDIWVRTNTTAGPHQNPEFGQTNYVHVTVRNRSTTVAAHNVKVKVHGTAAATSTSWQSQWLDIGEATVTYLAPGASAVVRIPWSPPFVGHYCLMSRLITPQDPIHFTETVDPNFNTRLSNNIIWRNTNVVNLLPFGFVDVRFILRNVLREPRLYNVRFRELDTVAGQVPFLSRGRVTLDLGPELTQVWRAAGGRAVGVKQVGETQFEVVDPAQAFFAIPLQAEQEFEVKMTFTDNKPAQDPNGEYVEYNFGVVQEDPQAADKNPAVGGVSYYLRAGPL
ncbi:M36 family metallopeptidase, partial [Pyxidicoccus sp. 3LFB2]